MAVVLETTAIELILVECSNTINHAKSIVCTGSCVVCYSSRTAEIYVPESLIDSYKAASVWTTINGYGYVTWKKLEGSIYE